MRVGSFLVNQKRGNQKSGSSVVTNLYLCLQVFACEQAPRQILECLTTRPAKSRTAALRKSATLRRKWLVKAELLPYEKARRFVGSGLLRLTKHVLCKATALLSLKGTIWRLPPLPKN